MTAMRLDYSTAAAYERFARLSGYIHTQEMLKNREGYKRQSCLAVDARLRLSFIQHVVLDVRRISLGLFHFDFFRDRVSYQDQHGDLAVDYCRHCWRSSRSRTRLLQYAKCRSGMTLQPVEILISHNKGLQFFIACQPSTGCNLRFADGDHR